MIQKLRLVWEIMILFSAVFFLIKFLVTGDTNTGIWAVLAFLTIYDNQK